MYTIYVVKFFISFNKIFLQYFSFYQEDFPVKINLENLDIKYKKQTHDAFLSSVTELPHRAAGTKKPPFSSLNDGGIWAGLRTGKAVGIGTAAPGPKRTEKPRFFHEMTGRIVWNAQRLKLKLLQGERPPSLPQRVFSKRTGDSDIFRAIQL